MSKIIMLAPENVTGASVDAVEYLVKKGRVKVKKEHVPCLRDLGFLAQSEISEEIADEEDKNKVEQTPEKNELEPSSEVNERPSKNKGQ